MDKQISLLKFYSVDDSFIKDLHDNVNNHVFVNNNPKYHHSRKYIGLVLSINGFSYYAPMSSPKNSDYIEIKGKRMIRNSILPIIRMVEVDSNGQKSLLGTIKLGNMIPVPESKLINYDLNNEQDLNYKALVLKEKRFINRHKELITTYAEALYNKKVSGKSTNRYLKATFDYKKFENYVMQHYSTQNNG